MEKANLPIEKASEPVEGAHQPMNKIKKKNQEMKNKKANITFSADSENNEKLCSQSSSNTYKDCLSQPAPGMTHLQKMLWLQKRRSVGLWVLCDDCERWRYLPHVLDRHELPNNWNCKMNPDESLANCSVPEAQLRLRDEEDLIHSEYSAGSLVWARLPGWPFWPAMVDDCPDAEQFYWLDGFSDIPTHYNVVFFDDPDVTRAWISPENLKPYSSNKKLITKTNKNALIKYKKRLNAAISQADHASSLAPAERLAQYSFIVRFKGSIQNPKPVNRKVLEKFQKKLKRKYNIDFPIEDSSDTDEENDKIIQETVNKNVIIFGTPKRSKEVKIVSSTPKTLSAFVEENIDGCEDSLDILVNKPNTSNDSTHPNIQSNEKDIRDIIFKEPSSMAVQLGSTDPSVPVTVSTVSADNTSTVSDKTESQIETQETNARVSTPSSDDFEF